MGAVAPPLTTCPSFAMNHRTSGLFQLRPGDSAHGIRIEPSELTPRPRVRAVAWIVVALVLLAGALGLWMPGH